MQVPICLRLDPFFPILYHSSLDDFLGMKWWDAGSNDCSPSVFHSFLGANDMVYHHDITWSKQSIYDNINI